MGIIAWKICEMVVCKNPAQSGLLLYLLFSLLLITELWKTIICVYPVIHKYFLGLEWEKNIRKSITRMFWWLDFLQKNCKGVGGGPWLLFRRGKEQCLVLTASWFLVKVNAKHLLLCKLIHRASSVETRINEDKLTMNCARIYAS